MLGREQKGCSALSALLLGSLPSYLRFHQMTAAWAVRKFSSVRCQHGQSDVWFSHSHVDNWQGRVQQTLAQE